MTQKKRVNKEQAVKGYAYSGIPAWLVKSQNDALKNAGITKKTRERAFFLPIWNDEFIQKGVPKKFNNIDAFTLEKACLYISNRLTETTGLSKLVFTPVPNCDLTIKVYEVKAKNEIPFAGMTLDYKDKMKAVQFLGKIRGEIQYDVTVSKELYEICAHDFTNGTPIVIYSNTMLEPGKIYHIKSFMWHKIIYDSERASCVMRPVHYLFRYVPKKPDYAMFKENIKNVNHWDDISFQWGYDTDTISLIMASVMYYEKEVPALNMVVFGDTQIGKSSIFKVLEKIFGDVSIAATKSTIKGLTGSAWESWTRGALMSCNYVALIDEIFRLGKQDTTSIPSSDMISSLLNALTEILEHTDKQAPSGKGSHRLFFNKSMMGMNNILDFNIFSDAWKKDPAPFNRISILLLGKDIKDRMRKLSEDDPTPPNMFVQEYEDRLLKKNINIATVREMFHYMRDEMLKRVEIDKQAFSLYMKQTKYVHIDYQKPSKFLALVKSATVFNRVFNSNDLPEGKIKPTNADYMQAVRWMDMIDESFRTIMGLK